ncbi:hypothetical protein GALL_470830 [mine drainage metagenome]|uniref:Uncharacterized protein n=1 Tax=mine drainage metagenome TaxID=410659 RepID=A0A1J5PU88_9ZZZZ
MLQNGSQTLQAHAGVHARRWQFDQSAVALHVKLHEHVVPDFNEAVAVLIRAARGATGDFRAVVVEDFRTRAAGTGVGHHPEVVGGVFLSLVVADADNPLGWQTNLFGPDVIGFLIVDVNRGGEFLGRQLVNLGQQFPTPRERLALEVVAKAPVPQHLEKRVVACGVTDVFQVVVLAASTQAGLHRGSAHVGALVGAQKHVLELHHARVGEHQCRVVARHQRTRSHHGVAFGGKEVEKGFTNVRNARGGDD